jgi:chromosome segregation ATPase
MGRSIGILPGLAAFLAGVAAGVLTGGSRERSGGPVPSETSEVKAALALLEARISAQETVSATRFSQIEAKLEDHSVRLADMPSTSQIVSAMEQILAKTMSSLDERLNSQARSIDTLKTTVAQTDSLLERVLESLDSLQSFSDSAEFTEDTLLQKRPA